MPTRQTAFAPDDPVMLRLFADPWFGPGTFLGYEPDPLDPRRLLYLVRDADGGELILPPLFVHRDGPEFRAWADAALALRRLEDAGGHPESLAAARAAARDSAHDLFAIHPHAATLGI